MRKDDNPENKTSFENVVKEKLRNFSVQVDDASWDKIEERLNAGRAKKKRLVTWFIAAAVAASIAILWLIFPFNSQISINHGNEYFSENESPTATDVLEEMDDRLPLNSVHQDEPVAFVQKRQGVQAKPVEPRPSVSSGDAVKEEPQSETGDYPKQEQTQTKADKLLAVSDPFGDDEWPASKQSKRRKKSSLGLLASVGSDYVNPNSNPSGGGPDLAPKPTEQSEIFSYEDFGEVKHSAPLSFGLSVRKELDGRFAIESGLVYTYLYTKFENINPHRKAKMHLHYLGIPINLVANIYHTDSWKVYASAGFMVEKGVHSLYKQENVESGSGVSGSTISGNIDGVQVSLNMALGIEYKLSKNYSLYFEPKAGYFFDNDQPVSVRTEHPFNIGIAAGIRFDIN